MIRGSLIYSIVWFLQYSLNWTEVNWAPLSNTMVSGRPWVADMLSSTLIGSEELVDANVITSCRLRCKSNKSKKVNPLMGPAKSTCTRLHGLLVYGQSIEFFRGGYFVAKLILRLFLTKLSLSMPGQWAYLLAIGFIQFVLEWLALNCWKAPLLKDSLLKYQRKINHRLGLLTVV